MYEFKLPDLGEGIHEGEILSWHVNAGDPIEEDAPLVDVETDKAAVTIPSPKGGTVVSTHGKPGDVVIVGQVIAVIGTGAVSEAETEPVGRTTETEAETEAESETEAETETEEARGSELPLPPDTPAAPQPGWQGQLAAPGETDSPPSSGPVPAAPATRRLARELGVDLRQVPPSGPAGRVTADDVRRFAAGAAASPAATEPATPEAVAPGAGPATTLGAAAAIPFLTPEPMPDFERWGPVDREPVRSIRRKIARKMVTSLTLVPHVIHMDEADVTALEDLRRRYRDAHPDEPGLTLLAFVAKAVTAGLRKAPAFNASLDPEREEIVYKRYVNIGLAADTPRGLLVPVVKGTDRKSVLDVSAEIQQLAARAREGTVDVEALQGGTFTITNIGPLGGIALAPAINYPEVAILGMGRATDKPVVRGGEIVIRRMLPLTLSFDHRVADGADAARFVSHVVRLLGDPERLLLEV